MATVTTICFKDMEDNWRELGVIYLQYSVGEGVGDRQISFITQEGQGALEEAENKGFCHHKFRANFELENCSLEEIEVGDRILMGGAEIEVTERYKECHEKCPVVIAHYPCEVKKSIFWGKIKVEGFVRQGDVLEFTK